MTKPLSAERGLADLLGAERYIVVGANSGGDIVARFLARHGKTIEAYSDLDGARAGGAFNDKPIIALEDVPRHLRKDTSIVIGTFRHGEVAKRLVQELGVDPRSLYPFVNDMFARHYAPDVYRAHAGAIARVRGLLSDAESRAYFDRTIAFYRTLDPLLLAPNPNAYGLYGYEAEGVRPPAGAVIADVGAFTGDSCEFYLAEAESGCFIYAIEAYQPNFQRLMAWRETAKAAAAVKPLHLALGVSTGALLLDGDPSIADACAHASAAADPRGSGDLVLCETLDNLFGVHFKTRIDLVKIDVEGADLDVVKGAEGVIARDRPVMAVASYHTPEHIWEIPLALSRLLGPARFYAGHDPKWLHQIHYIAVPERR